MTQPRFLDGDHLEDLLPFPDLIGALKRAFHEPAESPVRSHYAVGENSFLIMPAWAPGQFTGAKLVTIHPNNRDQGLPTIHGLYALFDGQSGEPLAVMDGRMLTLLRTAATSALAADHLARPEAEHHLVIGAGALAPYLIRAMASVRRIVRVTVWNRTVSRAEKLVAELRAEGFDAFLSSNLQAAVKEADIISTATRSVSALVRGHWLAPGTHLDLVGAYTPEMCEADSVAMSRSRIFVDTQEGARAEAGDLIQAVADGSIRWDCIAGDLRDLVTGRVEARRSPAEVSAFKSVGASIEDLAAAMLAWANTEPASSTA